MNKWVVTLARFGYFAYGAVYLIVGFLAFQAVSGNRQATDTQGALLYVIHRPYGKVVLFLLCCGLAGYSFWRFVQSVHNPEASGKITRIGNFFSGAAYGMLSLFAFRVFTGQPSAQSGNTEEQTAAQILQLPFGELFVLFTSFVILGVAGYQFWTSYSCSFRNKLLMTGMSAAARQWVVRIGRFGIGARGVVFCIIGVLFFYAAIARDAQRAGGFGEALSALSTQHVLIQYIVALGLLSYGLYGLIQARYRRIYANI